MALGQPYHQYDRGSAIKSVCSGGKYRMYTQDVLVWLRVDLHCTPAGSGYYDLRFRIVPNSLIIVSFVVGLVCRSVEELAVSQHVVLTLALPGTSTGTSEDGWGRRCKAGCCSSLLADETRATAFFLAGAAAGGKPSGDHRIEKLAGEVAIPPWPKQVSGEPAAMVPMRLPTPGILVLQIVLLIGGRDRNGGAQLVPLGRLRKSGS